MTPIYISKNQEAIRFDSDCEGYFITGRESIQATDFRTAKDLYGFLAKGFRIISEEQAKSFLAKPKWPRYLKVVDGLNKHWAYIKFYSNKDYTWYGWKGKTDKGIINSFEFFSTSYYKPYPEITEKEALELLKKKITYPVFIATDYECMRFDSGNDGYFITGRKDLKSTDSKTILGDIHEFLDNRHFKIVTKETAKTFLIKEKNENILEKKVVTPKVVTSKFHRGQKVYPVSKTMDLGGVCKDSVADSQVIKEALQKNQPYIFVTNPNDFVNGMHVVLCDATLSTTGDYFNESDLRPWIEQENNLLETR